MEAGQRLNATGRLTSVRQVTSSLCGFINGPLSGLLASGMFFWAAGANAFFIFSLFPVAFILVRERPQAVVNSEAFANARQQLKTIFSSWPVWFSLLFLALFYFSPGFSTPLLYKQTDELHLSYPQIGWLGTYAGAFGMIAAALYGFLIRRITIRTALIIGVAAGALETLLYLFYSDYTHAILIESQNGFFNAFAEVALIDLAARATPKGCEGLGYSLILSVRNIALFGADIVGSRLSDAHWPFSTLVFLNAGTTAVVLLLIPFMPRVLLSKKDGGAEPAVAA